MTKKQKKMLKRIIATSILYAVAVILKHATTLPSEALFAAFLIPYVLISYDVLIKSVKNIQNGQVFDENFLMALASIGALVLGEYSEAVAVMLFYQIGEWFQSYAVNKSRKSIAALMDIRSEYANIEVDGKIEQVDPEEVRVGQTIVINPGERVPLDGTVEKGQSSLDTSALTGESVPRSVRAGSEVISGCINQAGVLYVKVSKPYEDSTVAKILDLVENATNKKSKSEQFITKFARIYTPVVVFLALALAVIPSLVDGQWSVWVYRSLSFLVTSCPCALVISVPLSFFGGIGGASRKGILVKGSNYLQLLSEVKTIVFDKTGTITKGNFQVTEVQAVGMSREALLDLAAKAESHSTHPIALSIQKAAAPDLSLADVHDIQEVAGHGVKAIVGKQTVCIGNQKLMAQQGIDALPEGNGFGTCVYVSVDGRYAGMIEIADEIKEDSKTAIDLLRHYGVRKFVMLTGDSEQVAKKVAGKVGIDEVHAQLLPDQKVALLDQILAQKEGKDKVAFVGDGINDAPVLTQADVGIAMGGLGSDAAIEAADIVLMEDQLSQIVVAMQISKKTLRIVYENIVFALAIKVVILVLAALGITNMWAAVFADVGVSFLAILNAMRALRVDKIK
ncbi:heavy metal translocating P-type ATPase [uncultured Dubosiella sp.]|uniref:heavy metal translocating P-type ATPase n=1 Tax=uncultured Dubosiella sp. TaxID=1937011 RepID=UPI0025AEFB2C|nr:heavy metal translocating P-type ATPase [uncultured Dubosiella sp.]